MSRLAWRRATAAVCAVAVLTGCASGDAEVAASATGEDAPAATVEGSDAAPADGDIVLTRRDDGALVADAAGADTIVALDPAPTPQLPVTVTSADGVEQTIEDVDRVVVVTGSVGEIVFSLGLGDRVVGRDVATTFSEAADLPVVTSGHEISAEGVLSLRPTLVIGDTLAGPPEAIEQLRRAGVPVVLVEEAYTLEEVGPRIDAVATALGVPEATARLVERTDTAIADARALAPADGEPPRVAFLYLRGTAAVYLLGGDGSGADSLVEAVGAVDAGSEAGLGPYTPLTSEALIAAAPDVILVMEGGLSSVGGVDGLLAMPGIAQTPAAAQRRVIAVEDGLLLNFGPRTGTVLRLLARALYQPETAVAGPA